MPLITLAAETVNDPSTGRVVTEIIKQSGELEKLGFLGFSLLLNIVLFLCLLGMAKYFSKRVSERDAAISELTKLSAEIQRSLKEAVDTFKSSTTSEIRVQISEAMGRMETKMADIQKMIGETMMGVHKTLGETLLHVLKKEKD